VDHEVFLESSTLKAFLQFLDALPIKKTELIEPDVSKPTGASSAVFACR